MKIVLSSSRTEAVVYFNDRSITLSADSERGLLDCLAVLLGASDWRRLEADNEVTVVP